ncbi:MAG: hypothetical protein ABI134_02540 [Byssovorax sp.]
MMTQHTRPTLTSPHLPIVLAIGCPDPLLQRMKDAGRAFSSILGCDLASAHQFVADLRPCVLVVTSSLFDFDPPNFTTLAEEARTALVVLDDDESAKDTLQALLSDAITRARAARPRGSAGGYSVVTDREVIFTRRPVTT